MACRFLCGLLAPRCAARENFPVPGMVEEIRYCLGGEEEKCPFFRRASREGWPLPREHGMPRRQPWDWAP